jgi:hypothetical protein
MTTVSAAMFEIVEMHIFQIICIMFAWCMLKQNVIYSIFEFLPEIHFFETILPVFVD